MSVSQMAGAAFLVGSVALAALNVVATAVLPEIPPIVVHSLEYRDGSILQTRTIEPASGEVFWAQWRAQIFYASTGQPVPMCIGSGSWNYEAGTGTYTIPLADWVGSASCTPESLPAGCYKPIATWFWGASQTSHTGKEWCKE